ncbi:MAG: phage major capsid protein [Clostridia bacterium]|nr:phage major capsid protein [Clostridia bacterium]
MVTVTTADNALKSFYLDAVTESLNMKTNPFLARIQHTTADVVGKDIKKTVKVGYNGGIGAGSETGDLPTATASDYVQFTATLKNLYGTIEISDKALRASANNEGAFVNLLNDEMQSMIKSASFNFGRMLFGDGTGVVSVVTAIPQTNKLVLESVNGIVEGMRLDFYTPLGELKDMCENRLISHVDRAKNMITVSGIEINSTVLPIGGNVYIHGSKDQEITGIEALFADNNTLYGVNKAMSVMSAYKMEEVGAITENIIHNAIDEIEEASGSKINYIVCSWGVRRALMQYCRENDIPLPAIEVDGVTALSFYGIPVVTDRFCPSGTMYLLNTDDFKLYQLCDWQWLEGEDGKILKQVPGKPVYTATLVKYAELMCDRPCGQGKLSGITEA